MEKNTWELILLKYLYQSDTDISQKKCLILKHYLLLKKIEKKKNEFPLDIWDKFKLFLNL